MRPSTDYRKAAIRIHFSWCHLRLQISFPQLQGSAFKWDFAKLVALDWQVLKPQTSSPVPSSALGHAYLADKWRFCLAKSLWCVCLDWYYSPNSGTPADGLKGFPNYWHKLHSYCIDPWIWPWTRLRYWSWPLCMSIRRAWKLRSKKGEAYSWLLRRHRNYWCRLDP